MTTIRANCPTCGDVQLEPCDLVVRVCADDDRGAYLFTCPLCAFTVTKDATPQIVELLVSSGVERRTWRLPAELSEPRDGPTLTPDDLLDFHLGMQDPDWFDELTRMPRVSHG